MSRSHRPIETMTNAVRLLPARWALALLVGLIAYVVLQPRLNQWFGWQLPSIPALLGQEESTPRPRATGTSTSANRPSQPVERPSAAKNSASAPEKKYGILSSVGNGRFESPAGLIYAPGSEEGHRLEHIARHLEDDPNRPGSQGVFRGDMRAFLLAIDETYRLARGHAKGTRQRNENGTTIYEAPWEESIGFLGGTEGQQRGHPELRRMRIVVRGKNLITAFPVR